MRPLLLALLLGALAGCRGYMRPGATYQDFMQDYSACEMGIGVPGGYYGGGFGRTMLANKMLTQGPINHCMMARGWDIRRGSDVYRP